MASRYSNKRQRVSSEMRNVASSIEMRNMASSIEMRNMASSSGLGNVASIEMGNVDSSDNVGELHSAAHHVYKTCRKGNVELTYNVFDQVVTVTIHKIGGRNPRIFSALMPTDDKVLELDNFKIEGHHDKILLQCPERALKIDYVVSTREPIQKARLYSLPYHLPDFSKRHDVVKNPLHLEAILNTKRACFNYPSLETLKKSFASVDYPNIQALCTSKPSGFVSLFPMEITSEICGYALPQVSCAKKYAEFVGPSHPDKSNLLPRNHGNRLFIRNVDKQSGTVFLVDIDMIDKISIHDETRRIFMINLDKFLAFDRPEFIHKNSEDPYDTMEDQELFKERFHKILENSETAFLQTIPNTYRNFVSNSVIAFAKIRHSFEKYWIVFELFHKPSDFYLRVTSSFIPRETAKVVEVFAQFRNPAVTVTANSSFGSTDRANRLRWNLHPSRLSIFVPRPLVYLFRKEKMTECQNSETLGAPGDTCSDASLLHKSTTRGSRFVDLDFRSADLEEYLETLENHVHSRPD